MSKGKWIELRTESDKPITRAGCWFWRIRIYTSPGRGIEAWEYNTVKEWEVGDSDENRLIGYVSHYWSEPVEVVLPEIPTLTPFSE